ncbi:MAG: CoA activase [Deltaproteobacteria bacterium]|nr:CoA activase [Deltaproteobacteria bacterium]
MSKRFLGIDMGAETLKLAELIQEPDGTLRWGQRVLVEHQKAPLERLLQLLAPLWRGLDGVAVTGRLSRQVSLPRIPEKQARAAGYRYVRPQGGAATVVSIGSHGFSVLELREGSPDVFRENSRCSQGTGNFLRQLVERFSLTVEAASEVCESVEEPAPLSGRCPVILKTDMTHLANQGIDRARILAGLYDAVAENAEVLIKPRLSPPKVLLVGGVSRSRRIREHFATFAVRNGMTFSTLEEDEALFMDAFGCASLAAEAGLAVPSLESIVLEEESGHRADLPSLKTALHRVKRMPKPAPAVDDRERALVLGLDIGSTGSKMVAVDVKTLEPVWEGYGPTGGQPVEAARGLVEQFTQTTWARHQVLGLGATGSGREIVGSLLHSCYGPAPVFVLNEIAAHARGATFFEPRVDTIFEIGGQDAKYIRLSDGSVVDAAMNEACSAGTGSFIEEQGKRFEGIDNIVQMGQVALEAEEGVSLGQHCSVFMAEIIDEAVGAGLAQTTIVAGIYDSIIQNYLNRVKGSRSVGEVIFCQGMPFAADALAAAVARQTGAEVIIPPNPGTIGALGIAILTVEEGRMAGEPVDLGVFLGAQVLGRDNFICPSTRGCGGSGNKCRIDRISTLVNGKKQRFTWGGACSLYDKGTGRVKLPDGAPDPFRERTEYIDALIAKVTERRDRTLIAISDEFTLKGLFPLFATFLHQAGFDLEVHANADHQVLKRGIEEANVPFCAPMQQFHGVASQMAEGEARWLFLPMIRSLTKVKDETRAVLCPIVQASTDMLRWDLGKENDHRILSPVVDMGASYRSPEAEASLAGLAALLELPEAVWRPAMRAAIEAQEAFADFLLELGATALAFAEEHKLVPVVVLGRTYTIYNKVLNSNVPAILREQGALPIPVDCYPVREDNPVYNDLYWAYGQRNLRAAHQVRKTPGQYALWTSNYSCGPDSFNLHFFSYTMEGKPFAVIETDGHSGDAGTRTRVEAFLYTVAQDRLREGLRPARKSLKRIELDKEGLNEIRKRGERVLIPRMGPGAESVAAALRGVGVAAEALPMPDQEALGMGRRHTSGKECVPTTVTLGSLLQRLKGEEDTDEIFSFFMPTANGPCRFGVYNMFHKITLERLGWKDRVKLWSIEDSDYFGGLPQGFSLLVFAGFMAEDLLLEMVYDARPRETEPGAAERLYERYTAELRALLERKHDLELGPALVQVATENLFGVAGLLRRAAKDFARVRRDVRLPTVLMVGEIYVRSDPFSNDFTVNQMEARGIKVRFAPFNEWPEYVDFLNKGRHKRSLSQAFSSRVQGQVQRATYRIVAEILGWPARTSVEETVAAAQRYVRRELEGEAVLTLGGPLHEWHAGLIDGVVSVAPLECMPAKIAQAQFFHIAEEEGLVSLSLSLNGDPVDPVVWDNFAYEVKAVAARREAEGAKPRTSPMPSHRPLWKRAAGKALAVARTVGEAR